MTETRYPLFVPHLRKRYLESLIREDLKWSPIVSVLGMRQIGKTTLLRLLGAQYLTLDDDHALHQFEQRNWSALESASTPLIVDEAQKCPGLFDRVKMIVDERHRPGQFLLTGSVRFLSRKQIRESLTGRTSILELLPLTLAEAHGRPQTDFIKDISTMSVTGFLEKYKKRKFFSKLEVEKYIETGGMPGIGFKRSPKVRERMREVHIETLLMRDLQYLIKTRIPYVKLKALLSFLSQAQGQSISCSELGRRVQISTPTVIQVLRAFENLFIIRPHGKTWYFTDCGVATFLGAQKNDSPSFHMERFAYQELYAQLSYQHRTEYSWNPYLSRGGIHIPFVIELKSQKDLAIMVDPSEGGSEKSLKSLTWFNKSRRKSSVGVILHAGTQGYISSTGALCIPHEWIA